MNVGHTSDIISGTILKNCFYRIELNQTLISYEQPYVIDYFAGQLYVVFGFEESTITSSSNLEHGAFNFLFPRTSTTLGVLASDHGSFEVVFQHRVGDREGCYWWKKVSVMDAYAVGNVARVATEFEDLFSFRSVSMISQSIYPLPYYF